MVWKKGESGNPTGKPAGTRNKATVMVQTIMERGAKEIAEAVVGLAKEGDLSAARLVIERLVPPAKERPIALVMPDTASAEGIAQAQAAILQAVATGEILPGEGATLSNIVEARRKALETQQLEQRISALESKK